MCRFAGPLVGAVRTLDDILAGRWRVTRPAEPVASFNVPSRSDDHKPASLTVRTATGAGWIIAWRMTTRVLGLVNTLILVHLLLPADFGLVALATSMSNAVDLFSTIGVEQALIREKHLDRALYDTGFTIKLVRALAVGLVVAAGAAPVAGFYGDPRLRWILLALALGLLLSGLENIRVVDFQRDLAFDKRFQILLLPRIVAVLASISFALIYRNYWALVVGILTNRGMQLVLTYVVRPWLPHMTLRSWRRNPRVLILAVGHRDCADGTRPHRRPGDRPGAWANQRRYLFNRR